MNAREPGARTVTGRGRTTQPFGDAAVPVHALDELGARYRYPVYAFVRRCGNTPGIALDIAQAFVHALREEVRTAEPMHRPAQFRRYLLERLQAWLAADWRDAFVADAAATSPAEPDDLEARYRADGADNGTPEQAFQRGFAFEMLDRALRRLHDEAKQAGRADLYAALAPYLVQDPAPDRLAELAAAQRMPPYLLAQALHRLRQRLRELALAELADTVASADGLEHERQFLLDVLADAGA